MVKQIDGSSYIFDICSKINDKIIDTYDKYHKNNIFGDEIVYKDSGNYRQISIIDEVLHFRIGKPDNNYIMQFKVYKKGENFIEHVKIRPSEKCFPIRFFNAEEFFHYCEKNFRNYYDVQDYIKNLSFIPGDIVNAYREQIQKRRNKEKVYDERKNDLINMVEKELQKV
jgi:hypothetical protein